MLKIEASLTSHLVKPLKYYINSVYRKRAVPKRGSIVYSDFGVSGVYIGNGRIVTLGGEKATDGTNEVKSITVEEFIRNLEFPESIYVSSDEKGAIEDDGISTAAESYIGEKNKFGLVFKNSHSFVKKCLDFSEKREGFEENEDLTETYRSQLGLLKQKARNKVGAVKWLLWDFEEKDDIRENPEDINISEDYEKKISITENGKITDEEQNKNKKEMTLREKGQFKELNIGKVIKEYEQIPLNDSIIGHLNREYREMLDFFREINGEQIPDPVMKAVISIIRVLEEVIAGYEQNESSIKGMGGDFTFKELKEMGDEFKYLVQEMNRNRHIQDVLKKLGKGKLSFESKEKNRVARISRDEVFGIDKSGALSRVLTSELLNLEDENLKYLFYAKYLENRLLTYEIKGKNEAGSDEDEERKGSRGPIVICLDTSGSMKGTPVMRAKALVLSVLKTLKEEKRELHIILFGAKGQFQEIALSGEEDTFKAIKFLKKVYEGGTDFETPLKRAIEIISDKEVYNKADILMVTDGACRISYQFKRILKNEKERLNFKIYTVICEADRTEKDFSDGVIVI